MKYKQYRAQFVSLILSALALFTSQAFATDEYFTKNNLAVRGADVVAYFSLPAGAKAVLGKPEFSTQHNDITYHFSTAANRDAFSMNPTQYLPQYGGWCAYAIGLSAEKAQKAPIDIHQWDIVNGKLYLNFSAGTRKKWLADQPGFLSRAAENWPRLQHQAQ